MARHRHPTCTVGNADGGEDDRKKENGFAHLAGSQLSECSEFLVAKCGDRPSASAPVPEGVATLKCGRNNCRPLRMRQMSTPRGPSIPPPQGVDPSPPFLS